MIEVQKLLKQLNSNEEKAFEQVFRTYYASLIQYARAYVLTDEAEEVVQDVMIKLWDIRKDLVITTSLKAYLYTSVKNRCLNQIRNKGIGQKIYLELYEKYRDQTYITANYHLCDLEGAVEKSLNELPEKLKETFFLSRFSPLTNKEIGDRMGITEKAVEYRITQALKLMREKLKDYLQLIIGLLSLSFLALLN